jgi:hypothetical protein
VAGADITPVLVTRLINDMGDDPDQLPILQHALNRTWDRWHLQTGGKGSLDLPHYEAIGTMRSALDTHAEEIYAELGTPERQEICEKLFKALTDKATDPRGVRRPTPLATLALIAAAEPSEVMEVINAFRRPGRSFLMPPFREALEPASVIDISHESLMRLWRRLNSWADAEAQSARMYGRLAEAAALHLLGQASLWRNPELQLGLSWREENDPNEAWAGRYHPGFTRAMAFLSESDVALRRQERQRRGIRRKVMAGLSGLTALALLSSVYAWQQLRQARINQAHSYAATSRALLATDPLGAMVNGLAAMDRLESDPGASMAVSQVLTRAVNSNLQIDADHPGHSSITSFVVLRDGTWVTGGISGEIRFWKDGLPMGKPIATGQGVVWSLVELKNGELISGGRDGSLRRWKDGKAVGDGQPIATGQDKVSSLVELKNGELISGGSDGSLRRWRDGRPVGEPIQTGHGEISQLVALDGGDFLSASSMLLRWREDPPVGGLAKANGFRLQSLLELKNGELISGGLDGNLRRWKDGKQVGEPIPTGHDGVASVLELANGEIVSGG